jgi:endonuclease G
MKRNFGALALALALLQLSVPAFAAHKNTAPDPQPLPELAPCASFTPYGQPVLAAARPLTLLCRGAYLSAHDNDRKGYDWVAWTLTAEHAMGCDDRHNQFRVDHNLAPNMRASPSDYDNTGWDQGHGFPDMDGTWDKAVQTESFLMSNMSPQAPMLNRQGWEQFEADSRAYAVAGLGPLQITVVAIFSDHLKTIGKHHVAIPEAFAKVVYSPVKRQAVSILTPNAPVPKGEIGDYVVSVNDIELRAGITIPLPADTDKVHAIPLWPANLAGYTATKNQVCAHH